MSNKTELIQIKVTPEVKEVLVAIAEAHDVNISRVIEYALQRQFPEIAELFLKL